MAVKEEIEKNPSTEEKIKEAARTVFTRKGFAATRTRDIAEESGINLALINYYFRSKEKLFDIIMLEHLQIFAHSVLEIVNNRDTTLEQKITILVSRYIDILIANPNLPLFILNEVNRDPAKLIEKVAGGAEHHDIYMAQQWRELAAAHKVPPVNPIHILMNLVSMTIFPFIASPLLRNRTQMSIDEFNKLMVERKALIPLWIKGIIMAGRGAE